jgi:hypothetical protein
MPMDEAATNSVVAPNEESIYVAGIATDATNMVEEVIVASVVLTRCK